MHFEWDNEKNKINIRKHGIDFVDVTGMFDYPMLTGIDTSQVYGEDRWLGIGLLNPLIAVVVFVERHGDVIRIISARKATKREGRMYEASIEH